MEYISTNVPLSALSAPAGMAIALKLANLSAPLVAGKGSRTLMQAIEDRYVRLKMEAQALDQRENFKFENPQVTSEFVYERTT